MESFGHRIHHSSKFVLLDKQGQIRGYYDSLESAEIKQLIQDARSLLSSNGNIKASLD